MTADSPCGRVTFASEPLAENVTDQMFRFSETMGFWGTHVVADGLNIWVMNLEGAVMWTDPVVHRKEEGVMIGILLLAVDVHEAGHLHTVRSGKDIRCFEVEVLGIEVVGPLEVAY